ncbi:MAG TPA: hypothetical protein DHV63_12010 [Pseudomonas sp.]|nr:hypothetical protein [Pseudomonas sp.]
MRKFMCLGIAAVWLSGCQQLPLGGTPQLQGKFIDSSRAKPLELDAVTENPLLNNGVIEVLAGNRESDDVRGFGKIDLSEQMSQVESFQAPGLQAYCEAVLQRLLKQWPHEVPPIQVRFSASESFGARATADNVIYLNLGALQAIESEDELAAMLGHEASHLLLGHLNRQGFFNQQKKLLDASVSAVNLATTLANLESEKTGGKRRLVLGDPDAVGKTIMQSSLSGTLLNAVSDNLWNSRWSRTQEDDADLLSVDLLTQAGYSPRGAVHGIQRLQNYEGERQSQLARYQAQQQALFNSAYQQKGIGGLVDQGVQSTLTATQLAFTDVWQGLGRTHSSPAQREDALAKYIADEYRGERRREIRLASYQRQLLSGETGRILASQVQINRATRALENGDLATARKLARDVARGPSDRSMRGRTLQFLLQVQQGQHKQALASLEQVAEKEWEYASLSSYDQIISLSLSLDRLQQAERYLARGKKHWGEQMMAPMDIMVHLRGKRMAQAQQVYASCQQSRNKGLMTQCDTAIGGLKPKQTGNALQQLGIPTALGNLIGS